MLSWRPAVLGLVVLVAGAGCASRPPGDSEDPRPEATFSEVGSTPLLDAAPPESHLLLRCRYRAGPRSHDLPLETPLRGAGEAVLRDLGAILERLEKERSEPAPPSPPPERRGRRSPPLRSYEMGVARQWVVDLEIAETPGSDSHVEVRGRFAGRAIEIDADVPHLVSFLRKEARARLDRAMSRPRRPLSWHYVHLASTALAGSELDPRVVEYLKSAPDPGPVVLELVGRRVVADEQLESVESRGRISLRVLGLVRAARGGATPELRELTTLSLEYHAETPLFDRALRGLFGPETNPRLWSRYPADGRRENQLGFVRAVWQSVDDADFQGDEGWVHPGESR